MNPQNKEQIFESMNQMHSDIENVHYKGIKDLKNVTGVPINYYLMPISRLIDNFKIEKLYVKLEDTVIEKY
jgi:hypothetical protein